jgi:hypothetical protein
MLGAAGLSLLGALAAVAISRRRAGTPAEIPAAHAPGVAEEIGAVADAEV